MNAKLIESITKMIVEKLSELPELPSVEPPDGSPLGHSVKKFTQHTQPKRTTGGLNHADGMVKIWDHVNQTSNPAPAVPHMKATPFSTREPSSRSDPVTKLAPRTTPAPDTKNEAIPTQKAMVKLWDHLTSSNEKKLPLKNNADAYEIPDKILPELETRLGVLTPKQPEALKEWASKTPARVGIGRAGVRPKTETLLRFRLDHGAAVDAVYGSVPIDLLDTLRLFSVSTMVDHKEEYIKRPDLGRKLSEEGKVIIRERCKFQPKVQIIASDGLSSLAIEKNLEDVYLSFLQSLDRLGIESGTPFYIEKGRVASMDEVGEILQPDVVVLFIGERPGLVSSESLSAYLCFQPRKGTIEADRMVISNIHSGGIPPVEAGAYLGTLVQKILKYQASGVSLVRQEG